MLQFLNLLIKNIANVLKPLKNDLNAKIFKNKKPLEKSKGSKFNNYIIIEKMIIVIIYC